jgi:hypothetical protein
MSNSVEAFANARSIPAERGGVFYLEVRIQVRQGDHGPVQQARPDPVGVVRCERNALELRGVRECGVDPGRAGWSVLLGGPLGAHTEAAWVRGNPGRHPSCAIPS